MIDSRFEPRLLNSRACILNHYRKLWNYRAWAPLVVSEYRWQDDTNAGGKTDVILEEWSGLWSREGRRRGCSCPGEQGDKSRDMEMTWTFTFYFIFILHRVVISDLIVREGKDLTLLECGVGRSRLWGQWQRWGLKVFGGQRSECATANPRAKPSAKVAWGCSLLLEGWRSSGQHSRDPASGKNSPSEPRPLVWMPGKRTEKGIYRDRERGSPSPQELWGMFAPNTLHGTPASRSFGDWSEQRQLSN